ncbi:MAG: M3 family oligoendopeptidase [Bacteroidota bacterium]|jgi:oligoendopeptidase F
MNPSPSILPSQKMKRAFLPASFTITDWQTLEPYYKKLNEMPLNDADSLVSFLAMRSELDSAVSEELAWRYIRMNCDTTHRKYAEEFDYFIREIEPFLAPVSDSLNRKTLACKYTDQLTEPGYQIMFRNMKRSTQLFREENIPLQTELSSLQQEYGKITGSLTITQDGKELTLQQASKLLEEENRDLRKEVFQKICAARLSVKNALDNLLDQLIEKRQQLAGNAGFKNFRDYMHAELCRFDYSVEDCYAFHDSIRKHAVPYLNEIAASRKSMLGYDTYRAFDTEVDVYGSIPLRPFEVSKELVEKTLGTFHAIDPFFSDCLHTMQEFGFLDLESRIGKAPGGFNYPMMESGIPFIFMNAVGSQKDLVTMVHEGGHAIHNFLSNHLKVSAFKSTPSEVAELASMAMELISMEHWHVFYKDARALLRAKCDQLEKVIETLPWVAAIDCFQHMLYTEQTDAAGRSNKWTALHARYSPALVDYSGLEEYRANLWQKQLHIYEVPFYYIEYGMAQLGAIAVWRNYKTQPEKAIAQYKAALAAGNTVGIKEIYEIAGIRFDFSDQYVKELMDFTWNELQILKAGLNSLA